MSVCVMIVIVLCLEIEIVFDWILIFCGYYDFLKFYCLWFVWFGCFSISVGVFFCRWVCLSCVWLWGCFCKRRLVGRGCFIVCCDSCLIGWVVKSGCDLLWRVVYWFKWFWFLGWFGWLFELIRWFGLSCDLLLLGIMI